MHDPWHTVEYFLHITSIRVSNLGIDQASTSLSEDDALHGSGLFCRGYDVFRRLDEWVVDFIIRM
jgi:hypothetical protein